MKESSVFLHEDYRQYLKLYLQNRRSIEKGVQAKLAEISGCQPAYVSKVLSEDAHFSLEQAERVSVFCNHTEQEKHYFMLLVQYTRAGTKELRNYFLQQMNLLKEKNKILKDHMKLDQLSDLETQLKYYSRWSIAAIHVLLTIPEFRHRKSIAEKLNLSLEDINQAIDFLKEKGMVEENSGQLQVGKVGLHLGADSPAIRQHHTNWRIKAIDAVAKGTVEDLHYSSVVSLSKKDKEKFRSDLIRWIANFRKEVEASPEEDLAAITVDFFSV